MSKTYEECISVKRKVQEKKIQNDFLIQSKIASEV